MSTMTLNHGTEGGVSHNTTLNVATHGALVLLFAAEQQKESPQAVDVRMDVKEAKGLHAMLGHAIIQAERIEAARAVRP